MSHVGDGKSLSEHNPGGNLLIKPDRKPNQQMNSQELRISFGKAAWKEGLATNNHSIPSSDGDPQTSAQQYLMGK